MGYRDLKHFFVVVFKSTLFYFTLVTTVIVYWALSAANKRVTYTEVLCLNTSYVDTDGGLKLLLLLHCECAAFTMKLNRD